MAGQLSIGTQLQEHTNRPATHESLMPENIDQVDGRHGMDRNWISAGSPGVNRWRRHRRHRRHRRQPTTGRRWLNIHTVVADSRVLIGNLVGQLITRCDNLADNERCRLYNTNIRGWTLRRDENNRTEPINTIRLRATVFAIRRPITCRYRFSTKKYLVNQVGWCIQSIQFHRRRISGCRDLLLMYLSSLLLSLWDWGGRKESSLGICKDRRDIPMKCLSFPPYRPADPGNRSCDRSWDPILGAFIRNFRGGKDPRRAWG